MSQQSEDRLPESAPTGQSAPQTARILPFERPRSELQRAIQVRAQEAIDVDRDRDREVKRPQPLKWIVITAIALIPVILTFGAVDGFLRALHHIMQTYSAAPAPAAQQQVIEPSQPGVVLLQPYSEPAASDTQAERSAPPAPPASATKDQ